MEVSELINKLLYLELLTNARKLKFVDEHFDDSLDYDFLTQSISALNELSLERSEESKKLTIAICALLWTYRKQEWDGLKDYLILFLSRAGFGPSSIMIDSEYSFENKQFSFGESLLNQFAITIEQVKNEIKVGNAIYLLTNFQRELWESIDKNPLLGISAPTSAGKSFVISLKAIDLLQKKKGLIIYVVPTLSLVSQVISDFRKLLDEFELVDYSIETTYNSSTIGDSSIYILTQEKAIAAFSQSEKPFNDVRLLVIDEIQNVEKVADSDDQRSKVLYDLMIELSNTSKVDHIVISGPRILQIDELGKKVFGIEAEKNETDASPVLNLTYSISRTKDVYYFNLYSDLLEENLKVKISNTEPIHGYGKVQYDEKYYDFLQHILSEIGPQECNLIFAPTSTACSPMATYLSSKAVNTNSNFLNGLSNFMSSTVHPKFSLSETVKKGIAYHHGKLPFHIRILIEDSIRKKEIKTIICTTTLLQGVNLPIQNIIIRNPNLFTRKRDDSVRLSNYEIANLRGRAGRLLKDFIGRTFILDELSFQDTPKNQLELFKGSSKELKVGYGEKYLMHKESIQRDLVEGIGSTSENKDYSFLTTYLRQVTLRYGLSSQIYLSRVGISLSDNELNDIFNSISKIEVPKLICSKNRYWDPIDLDALYKIKYKFRLPTSVSEERLAYGIKSVLEILIDNFPSYYDKYYGVENPVRKDGTKTDKILQSCILAENWVKERSLSEILSNSYYDSSEKIDDAINLIQSKISYGLSLLLKPLYDIKEPKAMFPRFIELGAYKPLSRRLIELGIPREAALFLSEKFEFKDIDDKQKLINQLRAIRNNLPYWYKVQLSSI